MLLYNKFTLLIFTIFLFIGCKHKQDTPKESIIHPSVKSRDISSTRSLYYNSVYVGPSILRSGDFVSDDNGKSWVQKPMKPDFSSGLPFGYRRGVVTSVFDNKTDKLIAIVNAMDVPDLDPDIFEPPIAQETYYLRYRVSEGGKDKWLFDEPIIHEGDFTPKNPLPGIFIGSNSIYVGDVGSIPIVTKEGKILVPVQTTPLGPDGKLWNPAGGHTYTDVVVLIGQWINESKIRWEMSERIKGDPSKSTRGMIEPTLLEMENGKLLMVMRGSNDKDHHLPSYKWCSVSTNGGKTWSDPEPFTFEDDTPFFSPSSMSTLFKHSSGRCYWIGNMTDENCQGNLPRWPLVMAEVNTESFKLIKESLLTVDSYQEEDKSRGRLDISHFSLIEDRATNEIILSYPRSYHAYQSKEFITTRIAVE